MDNLRLRGRELAWVAPTWVSRGGWLANRSSLTDAGERRLVDLTGIVPDGDEPKASRRVPEHGRVLRRPNEVRELVDLTGIEPVTS